MKYKYWIVDEWLERNSIQQHPVLRAEGGERGDLQPPQQQELQRQRRTDLDQSDLRRCSCIAT